MQIYVKYRRILKNKELFLAMNNEQPNRLCHPELQIFAVYLGNQGSFAYEWKPI
jgi:hypothetical protein